MRKYILKSLPVAVAIALAAGSAYASDQEGEYHGYFRSGAGSSGNGPQACFGLGGVPKYRLGNECDTYGEFGYTKEMVKTSNGVSFVGTVMAAFHNPNQNIDLNTGSEAFEANQMFVAAKNISELNGGVAWMGKRFYNRPDIHMLDYKYLHGDGTGAGVENINLGPGKFSYALFRDDVSNTPATATSATRHSFIYDGLPVNPNGSLKFDATYIMADTQVTTENDGWSASVLHTQSNVLGGKNVIAVQYGSGPGINFGGTATGQLTTTNEATRTRIFDYLTWQVTPEFGGEFVVLFQKDEDNTGDAKWTTVGIRPSYAFTEILKLNVELGLDRVDPAGGGATQKLTKLTIAPTLAAGKAYFSRPELRLFYTYAKWNDAAQAAATAGTSLSTTGMYGTATHGSTIGLQAETWF